MKDTSKTRQQNIYSEFVSILGNGNKSLFRNGTNLTAKTGTHL